MSRASSVMRRKNVNAMSCPLDDDTVSFIEDVTDPDGRMYRLEYMSTVDGRHAVCFCRYNPWAGRSGLINCGVPYTEGHISSSGFLCLGADHVNEDIETSPYELAYVVDRARYWCTAFSFFKETGEFPHP